MLKSSTNILFRGLPWLFSVFVVLFLLLTILLFYFIFTTRDVYLSQKQALEEEDIKKKEVAAHTKQESEEDDETWKEHTRRKGKGKSAEEKVHVDVCFRKRNSSQTGKKTKN